VEALPAPKHEQEVNSDAKSQREHGHGHRQVHPSPPHEMPPREPRALMRRIPPTATATITATAAAATADATATAAAWFVFDL